MEKVSVFVALRADRSKGGKHPVVIRVNLKAEPVKEIDTGIKVKPEDWDRQGRTVKKSEPNHFVYNAALDKEVSRLDRLFVSKVLQGVPMTKTRIRQIVEGKDPGLDFYKFCSEWIPQKYDNEETLRAYMSEITKMKAFRKDVSFGDVDLRFLVNYEKYMEKKGNSHNTVWKSMKWFKTMMIAAKKLKLIQENPFDEHKMPKYENPVKRWLSIADCDRIEEEFVSDKVPVIMKLVAIRFLLMCYSGLRFADAMKFNPDQHVVGEGRIVMKTQKQKVQLNMKSYDRLAKVVAWIRENPKLKITNRDFNRYLKVIAGTCAIELNLTCHVGRHTFGGMLASMDVPEEQAQKLMAHKQIQSTRLYYHVSDTQLDNQMDKLKRTMTTHIPVTFELRGKVIKGYLTPVLGAASESMFFLMVNNYFYGQLWYTDSWKFASNAYPELAELSEEFGACVVSWWDSK